VTGEQQKHRPLWRNRDFMLLWSGQVVSTLGTRISALAYPLLVLAITGSPAQAGLVGFAQALPFLIWFLPAGALVDRWSRKRIMLVADAGRGIALGTVAIAIAADRITVGHLLAVAFVEGTLYVFFQLAEGAALPHVVPQPQIGAAVAQNQARDQGAELAGQPLGGFLFGLGHLVPFVVDTVTYLVSFVALTPIRRDLEERRAAPERRNLAAEISEGVRWLVRQRLLRTLVTLAALSNLGFNGLPLVLIVRAQDLGASPAAIGLMLGSLGIGALAGALAAPTIHRRVPAPVVLLGALWLWAAQVAVLVVAADVVVIGVTLAVGALAGPPFNVVVATYRYAVTPDRLQGRATSVARMIAWGTIPLSVLAAGVAVERFGAVPTIAALAALMLAVAVLATVSATVRRAPPAEDLKPTE
jgi:predicted MFS family arabinose efflux permease